MPRVVYHPRLGCWWSVAQRGVRSGGVVADAPAFGQHTQFLDRVEEFSVEELIAQLAVERFAVAVLPRRAGFDVQCFCASISASHLRRSFATNSGPLSERRCSGIPRITITSARAPITLAELQRRSARI